MNEQIMREMGFDEEMDRIAKKCCPICGAEIKMGVENFKDEPSYKEYTISGMCQKCQDEVFGES